VRTWEPGKDEREAGNGKATRKKKEKEKKSEKRERNQVVDTVLELKGTIDRASTMASSMRRAAAKACPTLIVKAPGAVVLVYFYLLLFASLYYYIIFLLYFLYPLSWWAVLRGSKSRPFKRRLNLPASPRRLALCRRLPGDKEGPVEL
jgi:Flp pilus assembly protein TadB